MVNDQVMTGDSEDNLGARPALQQVLHYHEVTKHHFRSYAQGPGALDWATQPEPFRRYQGARLVSLEKFPATNEPLYDDAFVRGRIPAAPVTFQTISQLFYHSLAISAWKSTGEHSWALRVNPSSGNLHPTEGYLICGPIDGLGDRPMVCHYAPKEHGLEVRAEFERGMWDALWLVAPADIFLVGLTSIHWREAWKYGQRAYRYCQHDVGHAIGAIVIAAAGLGWQTKVLDDLGTEELALLMGTGNDDAESEEPDVLMAVGPHAEEVMGLQEDQMQALRSLTWQGTANQLSPSHLDWGVETTAAAARKPRSRQPYERRESPQPSYSYDHRSVSLRTVVRQRRSAVAMDRTTHITRDTFYRILQRTLAGTGKHSVEHSSVDAAHSLGHFCSPRKGSSCWLVPPRARRVTDTRSSGSVHQGGSMAATRRMSAATGAVLPHRSRGPAIRPAGLVSPGHRKRWVLQSWDDRGVRGTH